MMEELGLRRSLSLLKSRIGHGIGLPTKRAAEAS
jgi:hypothetical protein